MMRVYKIDFLLASQLGPLRIVTCIVIRRKTSENAWANEKNASTCSKSISRAV